jgi:LacI family gluconate utilization system Gnt-I transcriptional repressor
MSKPGDSGSDNGRNRPILISELASARESMRDRRGARMSDVAKIAGVSAMTVSRAIRDPKIVNLDTLKRVQSAIEEVGYLPNRIAASFSLQRSTIVGQILPSLRNSLFVDIIQGVADSLGKDYNLLIADSGYTLKGEEIAIEAFLGQKVSGLVLHNTEHTARARRLIREAGVPCVETGNLIRNPIDISVGFSNRDAAFSMTEHLIRRKYRRIGFVSLPIKDNDRAAKRREGYIAAIEAAGRRVDESIILEAQPGLRSGGAALAKLVESNKGVDAVFLTGDVLAAGAVLEATRRGWQVPGDIAIAGSDDNELQENLTPPLTTIRFPRYEIGRNAGRLLLDRVDNHSSGSVIMDLGFKIIERQST